MAAWVLAGCGFYGNGCFPPRRGAARIAALRPYTSCVNIVSPPPSASPPASGATVTPIGTGRPWLARIPPGLFAIPFGLLGLAGAWRRMAAFKWEYADAIAGALLNIATGLLELLLLLWLVRLIRFRADVARDFNHPVHGAMLSLAPLSVMLAVALWTAPGSALAAGGWGAPITALALALQAVIAARVVSQVATGAIAGDTMTPALYLPPVGGGLIGAMALAVLGHHGWAVLLFGTALGGWALLEVRVLNRLFAGPLPPPLRPTLGVEIAPAPVATLAASMLWPALPADVLLIGLGVACGPILAVLARWRWWSGVPFSAGFWSFSFPVAAFASAIVETVRRGAWPPPVAYAAVLVATALILFLTLRTLLLLVRGRLIPPG